MSHLSLIRTSDGSHSVYNSLLNEHYHSTFGALRESNHVFIEAGLKSLTVIPKPLRILEVGFGTGLNALFTLLESKRPDLKIEYTALEPFPLDQIILNELNYISFPCLSDMAPEFNLMHSVQSGVLDLSENFRLIRSTAGLIDSALTPAHLIYFDAFAPDVQPELWTAGVFQKLYDCLQPGGVLVTYCAKGEVKRNMKKAGFAIERLAGPPGKREMTRATRKA